MTLVYPLTRKDSYISTSRASSLSYPSISVIIPARNEAGNLPHVLGRIPAWVSEVVLVDGHSTDATYEVVHRLRPDITFIQQTGRGKGDALRCGFLASHGDIVVMLDADGSTDPCEIERFVAPLLAGADFVKGSRFLSGGGSADITRLRRLGNAVLTALVNRAFHTHFTDLCYGYNAFWRSSLACFDLDCAGFEVETVLNLRAHKARLRIVEMPSYEHLRIQGESNLNVLRDGWRVLQTILHEWVKGTSVCTERRYALASVDHTIHHRYNVSLQHDRFDATNAHFLLANTAGIASLIQPARSAQVQGTSVADVSVIIATYTEARWDDLCAAVASVQCQTVRPREIVVVVDHNPVLAERVRSALPGIVVCENTGRRGLSDTRNTGIAIAQAETFLAFLDDDAVAEPNWLASLLGACVNEQVLGVGGAIIPAWQNEAPGWFPPEFGWVVGCSYRGLPSRRAPVRNLIGSSMLLRRKVLDMVGGFRTDIGRVGAHPVGCEETELCIRAKQHYPEGVFLYEPRARIWHRVLDQRATWRYFLRRCYFEGRSKALVARSVGAHDGLAAERSYLLHTLPLGVMAHLTAAALRHNPAGLARAVAISAGLASTTAGYAIGTVAAMPARLLTRVKAFFHWWLADGTHSTQPRIASNSSLLPQYSESVRSPHVQ